MNLETSKIQIDISKERVAISDRMPINVRDISIFLAVISAVAVFILGFTGLFYSLFFSLGYAGFRYSAWVIWKTIEIYPTHNKLTITRMLFTQKKGTEVLTNKFDYSDLILKEFEQSGRKRAMIQYQGYKTNDLMLLTHPDDIEKVKHWLAKNEAKQNLSEVILPRDKPILSKNLWTTNP